MPFVPSSAAGAYRGTLLALLMLLPIVAAAARDDTVDAARWPRDYDEHFQKYTKRYFGPSFDWRWFKAQAITESHLLPDARSAAGARGLMQILPSTFAEIQQANPHFIDKIGRAARRERVSIPMVAILTRIRSGHHRS